MFRALVSKEVNILAISTSISTVTCVIDGARVDDAIVAISEVFILPGQDR
jgi:aspartokinase